MGLFSGLIRLAYLKQRQLNIEYKIQDLAAAKVRLSERSVELVTIGNDLDPESPEYKSLEARREKLELMERRLDQEKLKYDTLLKAINVEIESAQKIVDNSVKRFFTYGT